MRDDSATPEGNQTDDKMLAAVMGFDGTAMLQVQTFELSLAALVFAVEGSSPFERRITPNALTALSVRLVCHEPLSAGAALADRPGLTWGPTGKRTT